MTENFDVQSLKTEQKAENDGSAAAAASSQAAPAAQPATASGDASQQQSNQQANPDAGGKTTEQIEADKKVADDAAAAEESKKKGAAAPAAGAAPGQQAQQPSSDTSTAKPDTTGKALTPDEIEKLTMSKLLKEAGVTSFEELKEKLKPKVDLTDDQKREAQQAFDVNLDKFAVDNKFMTRDEIIAFDNLQKQPATDIAFNEFAKEFKANKADATDVEVQQAFKIFYNLESDDATLKAIGEKKIQQLADEAKAAIASKREKAKLSFEDVSTRKAKMPGFRSTLQGAVKEYVPENLDLYSAGEDKVVFKLDASLNEEIEKFLVTDEVFEDYLKGGDSPQLKAKLKDRIDGYLFLKHKDKMFKAIYEAGEATGRKTGSNTGASASFSTNGGGKEAIVVDGDIKDLTPADLGKIGGLFNRN
jgi:hypothetical protein